MSLVLKKQSRPTVGYKILLLKDGSYGIATLKMTPNSDVVPTTYRVRYRGQVDKEAKENHALYRTNEALVLTIESTPGRVTHMTGVSNKNKCFVYKIGQIVKEPLIRTDSPDGKGIHFFEHEKFAKMWMSLLSK
jgi:hypothetical protein